MNNFFSGDSHSQFYLKKIQVLIKTIGHDVVNLNNKEKSIYVNYNERIDLFVMDSLTRCLNIKKSSDKDQVTTHCAVYFKLNDSNDNKIQKVKKLIVTSNKNADKLKKRFVDLFELIGYEIDDKNVIRKTGVQGNFLNILNYKFSNLKVSLNHYLQKNNSETKLEFSTDGIEVFEQWLKYLENIKTVKLSELDEKTKNALRDSVLFYFYLTIFYYFIRDFYCFNDSLLLILDPNHTPFYGLHCEMQLVSKYLNEIDKNNDYISISSDCCLLCHFVLKNLKLKYYGAKKNMCSSRYWKLPNFDREIKQNQADRINYLYENLNKDLKDVYNKLNEKKYKNEDKLYKEELPYSDEWIDDQFFYWRRLIRKKFDSCLLDLEKKSQEDDICNVLNDYKIYFTNNLLKKLISTYRRNKNKNCEILSNKAGEIVKLSYNFRINSIIELFYQIEDDRKLEYNNEKNKRKNIDNANDDFKFKKIKKINLFAK